MRDFFLVTLFRRVWRDARPEPKCVAERRCVLLARGAEYSQGDTRSEESGLSVISSHFLSLFFIVIFVAFFTVELTSL